MVGLPDIQFSMRPGIVEFTWGHPDLALLPGGGFGPRRRVRARSPRSGRALLRPQPKALVA